MHLADGALAHLQRYIGAATYTDAPGQFFLS